MSNLVQNYLQSDLVSPRTDRTSSHRHRAVSVLFVHRDADVIANCLEELKKAQFVVSADYVLNLAQCAKRLHTQSYDVVVAEYPCPGCKGPQALELLHQELRQTPLL